MTRRRELRALHRDALVFGAATWRVRRSRRTGALSVYRVDPRAVRPTTRSRRPFLAPPLGRLSALALYAVALLALAAVAAALWLGR